MSANQAVGSPPDAKPEASNLARINQPKPEPNANWAGTFFLWLLILASLSAGGYWMWQQNQIAQQSLQQIRSDFDSRTSAIVEDQKLFEKKTGDQMQSITSNLGELSDRYSGAGRDLIIAEVSYLLQTANYRLQLEHDVKTALTALDLADAKLRLLTDPAFFEVRQAIAKDAGALNAADTPDYIGMALTLAEFSSHVSDLKLKTMAHIKDDDLQPLNTEPVAETLWERTVQRFWTALKSLFVIRRHDKPVEPLISTNESVYLAQNLQLKFEQARLAILQRNDKLFHDNVYRITDWLRHYYDDSSVQTQNYLRKLDNWKQINIAPELPDISHSARVLDKVSKKAGYKPNVKSEPASESSK